MAYRPCNPVEEGCKAAPGLADSHTKATCFACGLPVCTNPQCSTRIQWKGYGRKRVCAICKDQERDLGEQR